MLKTRRLRAIPVAVLAAALVVASVAPAAGTVVFVPTREPAPEAWLADVPVDVDWADVSLRIPDAWTASVKRAPAVASSGASLLVAFGPGDTTCLLDFYVAGMVDTWQDAGVVADDELTIDGHPTERFDDMLGTGRATASAYSIDAGELVYGLLCTADQAPADRWLSIAETITVP